MSTMNRAARDARIDAGPPRATPAGEANDVVHGTVPGARAG